MSEGVQNANLRTRRTGHAVRSRNPKREGGAALLITAIILVVIGALAFTSIRHSEQESTGSARSRSATRTFYAADAGIQLAEARIAQEPPDLSAINLTLANGETVQSRTRSDVTPHTLDEVGLGEAVEGESLSAGGGAGTITRIYRVTVTATSASGSTSEVEAKISRTGTEAIGY